MDTNNRYLKEIEASLISIGYPQDFVLYDYRFSDFSESTPVIRKTSIVAFGREPFDYKSACISVNLSDDINIKRIPTHLRALGAPHVFIINNGYTERWNNDAKEIKLVQRLRTENLPNYIRTNKKYLEPNYIIRKKSEFEKPSSFQPDLFIDSGLMVALDHEASIRIDHIIRQLISDIEESYINTKQTFSVELVFKLIFVLLTAKLLSDRGIKTDPIIDFADYRSVLNGASNFYNRKIISKILGINKEIVQASVNSISHTISLNNLSIDTLTYIYENTFVSPKNRKELGIHSTPSYVADFILSKMPIENIPIEKLNIFDPMCGHGIFLVAAMRKLKEILPIDWNGKRRHKYFIKHLHGIEIDNFAIEVANMCLTLADFPESNGWQLQHGNVFKNNLLENYLKSTTVLVGNPPFEYENYRGHHIPKPALLLNQALPALPEQSYMGIVLPSAFLDSVDYRKTRETLLENFSLISITNLPANTFIYSASETSLIIAKKGAYKKNIYYSEVKNEHKENFKYNFTKTWEIQLKSKYFIDRKNLKVPFLNEVWSYLGNNETLKTIATIKIGVQNEPSLVTPKRDYKREKFKNSVPAIVTPEKEFYEYISNQRYYIPSEKRMRRRNAWNYNWSTPKVIIPTGRISTGPWKFAGAIDYEGRYATRNFYAVWSKKPHLNIETIAAILNSPLAAIYTYSHSTGRSIPKRVYDEIPIPPKLIKYSEEISRMVKDLLKVLNEYNYQEAKNKILQIDAFILNIYKLPPEYEYKLLKMFYNQKRPVPFEFTQYYPKEYESWIPLNIYISQKYNEGSIDNFLNSFPKIRNKETVKYLRGI